MNVGESIVKLRKNKNLNQRELALKSSLSQTYISQIENGKKMPKIAVLEKIAKSLGVPLPIIFWYSIELHDIIDNKKQNFTFLKPTIDSMIDAVI